MIVGLACRKFEYCVVVRSRFRTYNVHSDFEFIENVDMMVQDFLHKEVLVNSHTVRIALSMYLRRDILLFAFQCLF
jgi:hypothetical protein